MALNPSNLISKLFAGIFGGAEVQGNPELHRTGTTTGVDDDDIVEIGPETARNSTQEPQEEAAKFISFKEPAMLDCPSLPTFADSDRPLKVIIILGKARMGKSTFLNCLAAKAMRADSGSRHVGAGAGAGAGAAASSSSSRGGRFQPPFATSDDEEHCTKGMDYFLVPDEATGLGEDLLLLDCQGLAMGDSSHDPALLLAAYMLGDVLIFNDSSILKNDALKLLEPVCTFANSMEVPTSAVEKPLLVFRMMDADLVKDAQARVMKVLTKQKDQYQSIRDSLRVLFADIRGVRTKQLDKKQKEELHRNGLAGVLQLLKSGRGNDTEFPKAVEEVLAAAKAARATSSRTAGQWLDLVPLVLQQINTDGKISLDELDVVKQSTRAKMSEWIMALPADQLFTAINVDHTQASFQANVLPRMEAADKTMADFNQKFKLVGAAMRQSAEEDLKRKLCAPLETAQKAATAAALAKIQHVATRVKADRRNLALLVHTPQQAISQQLDGVKSTLNSIVRPLKDESQGLFVPVSRPLATWVDEQTARLDAALASFAADEARAAQAAAAEAAAIAKASHHDLVAAVKAVPFSCEDELLRTRKEATGALVEHVLSSRNVWNTLQLSAWLYVDICNGGVRILRGNLRRKRGRSDLRVWVPNLSDSTRGSWEAAEQEDDDDDDVSIMDDTGGSAAKLEALVGDIESQLQGRGFDLQAVHKAFYPPLYQAIFANGVARDHALLKSTAAVVTDVLQVAVADPAGPVHTAIDEAVSKALFKLYQDVYLDYSNHMRLYPINSGEQPLLLRVAEPQRHPQVGLRVVDLREPLDINRSPQSSFMLMTEQTYNKTWREAFKKAAQKMVNDGMASDTDEVLGTCLESTPVTLGGPIGSIPCIRFLTAFAAGGADGHKRWSRRGAETRAMLPELFIARLKEVVAQDDLAVAIFGAWRPVTTVMGERLAKRQGSGAGAGAGAGARK